jgi:hypothetical protein
MYSLRTDILALTTIRNLTLFITQIGRVGKAKELYVRNQHSVEVVFGGSSRKYENIICI